MADQDDICKLGRLCCALSPVPWSQYRSEIKEDFIGRCCQPSQYSTLRFFSLPRFLSKTKTKMSQINMRVDILPSLAYKITEKLLRYSTCWKFRYYLSRNHFVYMQRTFAACIATYQLLNHWPISYIFIPTKFTFLFSMFFNFFNGGWAGRER